MSLLQLILLCAAALAGPGATKDQSSQTQSVPMQSDQAQVPQGGAAQGISPQTGQMQPVSPQLYPAGNPDYWKAVAKQKAKIADHQAAMHNWIGHPTSEARVLRDKDGGVIGVRQGMGSSGEDAPLEGAHCFLCDKSGISKDPALPCCPPLPPPPKIQRLPVPEVSPSP